MSNFYKGGKCLEAIIGVIGTLFGTILGWLLNSASNHGKLNVNISDWKDDFKYNDKGFITKSISKDQTEYYSYLLTLDIYNSSAETKIMRNIEIYFSDNECEHHKSIPKDDSTKRNNGYFYNCDNISPVNIPPKTIIQLKLRDDFNNENAVLNNIWKTKKIYMKYINEKNKIKKVTIKSEDYGCYFEHPKQ